MKTTEQITVTDGRLKRALQKRMNPLIQNESQKIIKKELNNAMVRLGKVTKFYPYLDKAEVKLDNSSKKILCKLPHRFVGSIIDFYTPAGSNDYCSKLKEPCIIPRDPLNCLVVNIHDEDSNEYLLVSYYLPDEIIGFSPPSVGTMRIANFRVSCEDYIEFGGSGLKIQSKVPFKYTFGEYEDDLSNLDYVSSDNVYTKEEVYTKKEVDKLIAQKIEEALQNYESNGDENDGVTS